MFTEGFSFSGYERDALFLRNGRVSRCVRRIRPRFAERWPCLGSGRVGSVSGGRPESTHVVETLWRRGRPRHLPRGCGVTG